MKHPKYFKGLIALALSLSFLPAPMHVLRAEEATGTDWYSEEFKALQDRQQIDYEIANLQAEQAANQAAFDQKEKELEELKKSGKAKAKEYKLLQLRLKRGRHRMKTVYTLYNSALVQLQKKQDEFRARALAGLENGRPSNLSMLLNSRNLSEYFTAAGLAAIVADADIQQIEALKHAQAFVAMLKGSATETMEQINTFMDQIKNQMSELEKGKRISEEDLRALNLQMSQRSDTLTDLQYRGVIADANLKRARDEIAYMDTANGNVGSHDNGNNVVADPDDVVKVTEDGTAAPTEVVEVPDDGGLEETDPDYQPPTEETPDVPNPPDPGEDGEDPDASVTPKPEEPEDPEETPTKAPTEAPTEPPTEEKEPTVVDSDHPPMVFPNTFSSSVTSPFGWRSDPFSGYSDFHTGCDFQGSFGASIVAAMDGIAYTHLDAGPGMQYGGSGYGNYIDIVHPNGWVTRYGHLMDIDVENGQQVSAGQHIGRCGSTGYSTGPHLHFEIIINGTAIDPLTKLY